MTQLVCPVWTNANSIEYMINYHTATCCFLSDVTFEIILITKIQLFSPEELFLLHYY